MRGQCRAQPADPASDESLSEAFWSVARQLREKSARDAGAMGHHPGPPAGAARAERHGTMRLSELSDHLHIAPRSTTEVVDALEARDLVRRRADPATGGPPWSR